MKKRKLKITPIIIAILIICAIIFGTVKIVNTINYHKTYEYKLLKIGYSKEEFQKLDTLTDETKDYILTLEYNKDIISLLNE